MQKFRIFEFDY